MVATGCEWGASPPAHPSSPPEGKAPYPPAFRSRVAFFGSLGLLYGHGSAQRAHDPFQKRAIGVLP